MLDCGSGRGRNKSEPVLSMPLGVQCGPNTEIVPGISDGSVHIKDIQKQSPLAKQCIQGVKGKILGQRCSRSNCDFGTFLPYLSGSIGFFFSLIKSM